MEVSSESNLTPWRLLRRETFLFWTPLTAIFTESRRLYRDVCIFLFLFFCIAPLLLSDENPLTIYADTRPKLVAGSAEGYTGHVDGKPRDARMNRPKALTVDDRGNIYVADTVNMVIRKISDTGK